MRSSEALDLEHVLLALDMLMASSLFDRPVSVHSKADLPQRNQIVSGLPLYWPMVSIQLLER